MSEIENGEEYLSPEEISAEVKRLLDEITLYNNLKPMIAYGRHCTLTMIESDPDLLNGEDKASQSFREIHKKLSDFSLDLREEMAKVALRAEDGIAYMDIRSRTDRVMADIIFLREFVPKVKELYKRLHYKNGVDGEIRWDQQTLGTLFPEEKID